MQDQIFFVARQVIGARLTALQILSILLCTLLFSACSTPSKAPVSPSVRNDLPSSTPKPTAERPLPILPAANSGRGGYYQDDGPGDSPPAGLYEVPDAEPKIEALARTGNKTYVVFGKTYTPLTDDRPFTQRGIGSWYGKKFHGQRTSSGEPYDMYKMTAAHPILPIPSYARVTHLLNGKQVIVRINDRGPFHAGRAIDLSYTAALKLGLLGKGRHEVEVERLLPDDIARLNARKKMDTPRREALADDPILALSERDARQIRELDRSLRSESILPAPATAALTTNEFTTMQIEQGLHRENSASIPSNATNTPHTGKAYYLQLGAFSQEDNAEAERQKLAQSQLPKLEVVQTGKLYRLYSGPFASRAEAQNAALLAQHSKAMVVQR